MERRPKPVLIGKNIEREGPALLRSVLDEHEIPYKIVELEKLMRFPDVKEHSAVVIMGGPDSANDETVKMQMELNIARSAVRSEVPYLGVCLGMQVLVNANGGGVVKSDVKEVGWKGPDGSTFHIELTEHGRRDPLFKNVKIPIRIFHLHGETVELTENMELLGSGKFVKNQVVKVGDSAYGIQGHLELDEPTLKVWLDQDPDLKQLWRKRVEEDYRQVRSEYEESGKQIFTNFLRIAKLID